MIGEDLRMHHETESVRSTEIHVIAPDGLGYGDGSISVKNQIESGKLTTEALHIAIDVVRMAPTVFTKIDDDARDDGCGDGRPAGSFFKYIKSMGEKVREDYSKSRRRAKVFGGGLIVASSMNRVLAGQPMNNETVYSDREQAAELLQKLGIEFGAHTDTSADGETCGCGAIDKYPAITANVLKYRSNITTTLEALYGDTFEENLPAIETVFSFYETLLSDHPEYFNDASGKKTMKLIEESGSVIKVLTDEHQEGLIVANDIDGTTFDQREFDKILKEQLGEDSVQIQVFTFDTWRGRMYAEAVVDSLALEDDNDRMMAVRVAYADFLIRSTVAVAATLTPGDQPVIGRVYSDKQNVSL